MFTEELFIIAKKSKQFKCPSVCEWVTNIVYPQNRIIQNEVLMHIITWKNHENLKLNKRGHK